MRHPTSLYGEVATDTPETPNGSHPLRFSGRKLQVARTARGLTREQLGLFVDRSAGAVRTWECGERCPTVNRAAKLAHLLGVTLDDLLV